MSYHTFVVGPLIDSKIYHWDFCNHQFVALIVPNPCDFDGMIYCQKESKSYSFGLEKKALWDLKNACPQVHISGAHHFQ